MGYPGALVRSPHLKVRSGVAALPVYPTVTLMGGPPKDRVCTARCCLGGSAEAPYLRAALFRLPIHLG